MHLIPPVGRCVDARQRPLRFPSEGQVVFPIRSFGERTMLVPYVTVRRPDKKYVDS